MKSHQNNVFICCIPTIALYYLYCNNTDSYDARYLYKTILGCVYLPNFWLESGFSNVFQANLGVDKRKAFFKGL